MADIQKPATLNVIWAESGDKIKPEDSKIQIGWLAEIPPRQYFNYMDNRRDTAIAHINQHGIGVWDAFTEYQALRSYVQGSDGVIYRALQTNISNNPVEDNGTYWTEAFLSVDSPSGNSKYIGYLVRDTSFTAVTNNRYYLSSPLVVTLPDSGMKGEAITMVKRPNITSTVRVSIGNIVTAIGSDTSVEFDLDDEINFIFNGDSWEV